MLHKLTSPFAGFFLVLFGGTVGYHIIEGWSWFDSFWMVLITLTTIGYGEPIPLSPTGRIFTVAVIVGGVGLSLYAVGRVTRYIVEGELARDLVARRRRRQMNKLSGHYIVVGYGRLGREVVAELHARGLKTIVIDSEEEVERKEPPNYIIGDATQDVVLEEAAIDRAQGLAVCTGSDPTNVFVTLTGRQLNPDLHILARVDDPSTTAKAARAGANGVINPHRLGGARMAQGLLHPYAGQIVDQAVGRSRGEEFAIEDIAIGRTSELHGDIRELGIASEHHVLVLAVRKPDGKFINATQASVELSPGDVAVVVGRPDDIASFAEAASR